MKKEIKWLAVFLAQVRGPRPRSPRPNGNVPYGKSCFSTVSWVNIFSIKAYHQFCNDVPSMFRCLSFKILSFQVKRVHLMSSQSNELFTSKSLIENNLFCNVKTQIIDLIFAISNFKLCFQEKLVRSYTQRRLTLICEEPIFSSKPLVLVDEINRSHKFREFIFELYKEIFYYIAWLLVHALPLKFY